jgi:hypothetical protein
MIRQIMTVVTKAVDDTGLGGTWEYASRYATDEEFYALADDKTKADVAMLDAATSEECSRLHPAWDASIPGVGMKASIVFGDGTCLYYLADWWGVKKGDAIET